MSPNTAVVVGSTATFTCHTDSKTVCWTYDVNISGDNIFDVCEKGHDDKFIDRCNVTTHDTEGTVTLTINDVRLNDVGFYFCGDCFEPQKATSHLLVLGKKLKSIMLTLAYTIIIQIVALCLRCVGLLGLTRINEPLRSPVVYHV